MYIIMYIILAIEKHKSKSHKYAVSDCLRLLDRNDLFSYLANEGTVGRLNKHCISLARF